MSKRLQVLLKDPEYREIRQAAQARNMSVAEWVRQALSLVRRREPSGNLDKKIQAVRAAARCQFPTADIDRMLAEIESGYGPGKNIDSD
jgi:hypothetical protein